jgi:hypothetical protein
MKGAKKDKKTALFIKIFAGTFVPMIFSCWEKNFYVLSSPTKYFVKVPLFQKKWHSWQTAQPSL